MWGNIAISFLLAFIVSFMATPYSIKIAEKIGATPITQMTAPTTSRKVILVLKSR